MVLQTINPKTGRINNPKKGTYYPVILLTKSETGFVSSIHLSFNGAEEFNKNIEVMYQNFDKFTPEQIKHVYTHCLMMLKVETIAIVQYCGADLQAVKNILHPSVMATAEGLKTGANVFNQMKIYAEALNACKIPNFNPFRVTEYNDVLKNKLNNPVVTQISDHDKRNGETIDTIQAEESAKAVIREVLQ
jgi:hypothetical protein